jgi:hypothetical protein
MKKSKKRKKGPDFLPTRGDIALAVQEYLSKGGKLTKLNPLEQKDLPKVYIDRYTSHFKAGS